MEQCNLKRFDSKALRKTILTFTKQYLNRVLTDGFPLNNQGGKENGKMQNSVAIIDTVEIQQVQATI